MPGTSTIVVAPSPTTDTVTFRAPGMTGSVAIEGSCTARREGVRIDDSTTPARDRRAYHVDSRIALCGAADRVHPRSHTSCTVVDSGPDVDIARRPRTSRPRQ